MTARDWTPRGYQGPMVDHVVANPRCALFASMGMGKTVCTLTAIDALLLAGAVRHVLVLGPLRVARTVWGEEVKKWTHLKHLRVVTITGTAAERAAALATPADIHTMNYENVEWLANAAHLHGGWKWDMVVADECTVLKGFRSRQGSKRAQALSKFAFKEIRRWVNLTGTPAPNGLQDLWGQAWFLDQGFRLGKTYSAFENRWFGFQRERDATHGGNRSFVKRIAFPHAQADIQGLLKDLCLTVDPKDHFPLDEPTVITIKVEMPAVARAIYRNMEREMFAQIEEHGIEAFNAASKSIKMLQIANGAAYTGNPDDIDQDTSQWVEVHDEKLQALDSIIAESGGTPILVAYHFRPDLVRLLKRYPQARHIKSIADEAAFKAGKVPIALVHAQSVGHGVDGFQNVSNIMVFFAHWWAMEQRAQLIERIGPVRQIQAGHVTSTGRNRPVFIYNIVASGTIDELVIERIASKRSVQAVLLDAMKRAKAAPVDLSP